MMIYCLIGIIIGFAIGLFTTLYLIRWAFSFTRKEIVADAVAKWFDVRNTEKENDAYLFMVRTLSIANKKWNMGKEQK